MTDIFLQTLAAAGANPNSGSAILIGIAPWLLIFVIFYVLMIRPQQKRVRDHQTAIAAIKKGDEVITGGGIRGKVTKVTDDEAEVEISPGPRGQGHAEPGADRVVQAREPLGLRFRCSISRAGRSGRSRWSS